MYILSSGRGVVRNFKIGVQDFTAVTILVTKEFEFPAKTVFANNSKKPHIRAFK